MRESGLIEHYTVRELLREMDTLTKINYSGKYGHIILLPKPPPLIHQKFVLFAMQIHSVMNVPNISQSVLTSLIPGSRLHLHLIKMNRFHELPSDAIWKQFFMLESPYNHSRMGSEF